ncbi:hypothetical protein DLAC_09226 [Tieghemostelium lacteum]|uniref:Uncharacterized protein n=1 Tax=Tieghemostelium lacteum TaxID=361077 RepID=A0A151Z9G7_TIELA|nr:hypothetical protein DLAC_09226 [Tieghemostelium lacteum]|eukprot:KYQ90598.1 hypothetical protein DLAC_09226 [Tieghemostelium lacteum]
MTDRKDLITYLVNNIAQITEDKAQKTVDILEKECFELSKKGLYEVLTNIAYQDAKEKIFTEDNGWNGKNKGDLLKICQPTTITKTTSIEQSIKLLNEKLDTIINRKRKIIKPMSDIRSIITEDYGFIVFDELTYDGDLQDPLNFSNETLSMPHILSHLKENYKVGDWMNYVDVSKMKSLIETDFGIQPVEENGYIVENVLTYIGSTDFVVIPNNSIAFIKSQIKILIEIKMPEFKVAETPYQMIAELIGAQQKSQFKVLGVMTNFRTFVLSWTQNHNIHYCILLDERNFRKAFNLVINSFNHYKDDTNYSQLFTSNQIMKGPDNINSNNNNDKTIRKENNEVDENEGDKDEDYKEEKTDKEHNQQKKRRISYSKSKYTNSNAIDSQSDIASLEDVCEDDDPDFIKYRVRRQIQHLKDISLDPNW